MGTADARGAPAVPIVAAASSPAPAHRPAAMNAAVPNPAENRCGSRYALPTMPTTGGRTATATRFATRPTSLLTADATPACSAGTAVIAAVVNGATVHATPRANTTAAGSISVR